MLVCLPDEVLHEILSCAISIPDDLFTSANCKTFARYFQRSTSDYLLVCKDWLRIGTPLLYNDVILRSNGQIQALEETLKSTRDLGPFIKRVRIEGGYCALLHYILKSAVNLTDLCLGLDAYSYDRISGILKGLQEIQPQRLVIYRPAEDMWPKDKDNSGLVARAIAIAIPKWTKLVRIY
jgi:hypothetical protein